MSLEDLVPTLQLAIGPVILISGVGLLLLSMTNRFGRVIDRTRALSRELGAATGEEREKVWAQLRILSRRAILVRRAIAFASYSVLLAALLVISLFVGALWKLAVAGVVTASFVSCLGSLVIGLFFFIADINLSLKALWLEMPSEK